MQLRDYQTDIAQEATALLRHYKIAYLCMEVRTGKTLTALHTAALYGASKVLFLTKKKAIRSIENDYAAMQPPYHITITNYENINNIEHEGYDLVILDEASCLGQFPVPAKRTRNIKNIVRGLPIIFLSGTPTPESYSQIFHQLYVSSYSPFAEYKTFYHWAARYVFVEKVKYNGYENNDYSMTKGTTVTELMRKLRSYKTLAEDKPAILRQIEEVKHAIKERENMIKSSIAHLMISYTQAEAGFKQEIKEHILTVRMKESTYYLARKLRVSRLHIGKNGEEIIADTNVKLMQKLHQVYSGTVLTETGNAVCFDTYKVDFIKRNFEGKKIAIYYKFQAELSLLQAAFGDRITFVPEHFNETGSDIIFVSQMQSGAMGINLSAADCLVMMNIDFSSTIYQQVIARLQSKDRETIAAVYWIFADEGIEHKIYERVRNKQSYTRSYFEKDYNLKPIKNDKKDISLVQKPEQAEIPSFN